MGYVLVNRRGKMQAVSQFEEIPGGNGRQARTAIIVTEIPYQVNKAALIEKIAELVRDKKIEYAVLPWEE